MAILQWIRRVVWPWKEITLLRHKLNNAETYLFELRMRDSTHHYEWVRTANMFWGPEPLTPQELNTLNYLYRRGYGWRQALDYLMVSQDRLNSHPRYDDWRQNNER